jgi:energy-coupling factor transporter ATP-binding protein EcfA2
LAAVIRLSNIRYRYPGSEWILNGIDYSINKGEYTAILGANGSGKSTIGYLLNGLVPHFFDGILKGAVVVNGVNTKDSNISSLFSQVGLVLQNADAQLFNSTVENEIAFGLESLGLSVREIQKRINEAAAALHIENLLDRSPDTLSGGEKRLAAIASVFCLDPAVLVLDEPFANLDWKGMKRVRNLLMQVHQSGKNMIVIEQRIKRFLQDSTRCLIVEQGKIRYEGRPDELYRTITHKHLVPQYPRRTRNSYVNDTQTILKVKNLSYSIGKKEILKKVSFEVGSGETIAIVGENGSGKTTLIKHFNGLLHPAEGEVVIADEKVRNKSPAKLALSVGLCFQNPNDQFFKNRVEDEILVGPKLLGKKKNGWFQEVCDVLDLHALLDRSPYRLSEGEKKRVALASILAMGPDILILDEPTVGQDGRFKEALAALLKIFEEKGFTLVIVTHDLDFALATTDRWIVLHDGRVVADGNPQDIRHDEQLIRLGALDISEEGT